MNKRKNYLLLALWLVVGQIAVGQVGGIEKPANEGVRTLSQFRRTSPFVLDENRNVLWEKIQEYSDSLDPNVFKAYLNSAEEEALRMEKSIPILHFYRAGFDKVLHEVKNTEVAPGTASVWLLYNMGFVVKTPSGCFGIDVDHRLAEELEPYLDFLCITHNHGDHAHVKLMEAMTQKGKPVISNFYKGCPDYLSTVPTSYQIGDFTIRTAISDHLRSPDYPDFVAKFRIECGAASGNFSILHCGDSGFLPKRFTEVQGPVNLLVLRWGAPRENDILGVGEGRVQPDYAVLSHLIELRHKPYPHGQASITKTLEHLPNVACDNTILPFWGERLVWENGKMTAKP